MQYLYSRNASYYFASNEAKKFNVQGCQQTIVPKEKRTQLSKRGFFTSKKDIFSISFNDIFQ